MNKFLVLLLSLLMVACAANPQKPRSTVADELYKGAPKTAFATETAPLSRDEAAARADTALAAGDLDRALYFYVEAVNLDRHDIASLLKIGAIHSRRSNDPLALTAYRMVLIEQPENAEALEGAGLILFRARQTDDAEKLLTQAITREPTRWRAHDALGVIADLRQDHAAAIAHYDEALKLVSNSARLYNNRGYSRYLVGDLEEAVDDFTKAISIDQKFERAWRNLALVRIRQDRYAEALQALREVSDEPKALNDVGYLAMLEGKYDVAEKYLNAAAESSPTFYKNAHQNLDRLNELRAAAVARAPAETTMPLPQE